MGGHRLPCILLAQPLPSLSSLSLESKGEDVAVLRGQKSRLQRHHPLLLRMLLGQKVASILFPLPPRLTLNRLEREDLPMSPSPRWPVLKTPDGKGGKEGAKAGLVVGNTPMLGRVSTQALVGPAKGEFSKPVPDSCHTPGLESQNPPSFLHHTRTQTRTAVQQFHSLPGPQVTFPLWLAGGDGLERRKWAVVGLDRGQRDVGERWHHINGNLEEGGKQQVSVKHSCRPGQCKSPACLPKPTRATLEREEGEKHIFQEAPVSRRNFSLDTGDEASGLQEGSQAATADACKERTSLEETGSGPQKHPSRHDVLAEDCRSCARTEPFSDLGCRQPSGARARWIVLPACNST